MNISLRDIKVSFGEHEVFCGFNWEIAKGENWLLHGPSGSGKSVLAKVIANQIGYGGEVSIGEETAIPNAAQIHYVPNWYEFTNSDGDRNFYYQQRYNHAKGSDSSTVRADLKSFAEKYQLDMSGGEEIAQELDFQELLNSQLIELSSGEHKKIQLIKGLLLNPDLLILDQPYNGLDKQTRKKLNLLLERFMENGKQLMILQTTMEYPVGINRFGEVNKETVIQKKPTETNLAESKVTTRPLPDFLMEDSKESEGKEVVAMRDIIVRYGDKIVLNKISWTIRHGEAWLLQGHNGSGKSTLLSLLNADHPQAYSHDIRLFGNQRGSGESIWEIKSKIGMISPELHWYYDTDLSVYDTIGSGLYDSIGLYNKLTFFDREKVNSILRFFDLESLKNKPLGALSLGKQRQVLLARTLIKNPELLIFDEPCQGLDDVQTQAFNAIVDELTKQDKTLIYVGHEESKLPTQLTHRMLLEKGKVIEIGNLEEQIETA